MRENELGGDVCVGCGQTRERAQQYLQVLYRRGMYVYQQGEWKGNLHDSKYGTETKWVGRVN